MSLQNVLGQMIASGLGGRTGRGQDFLSGMAQPDKHPAVQQAGMDWKKMAGIAALAYVGYRAVQGGSDDQPKQPEPSRGSGMLGGLGMFNKEGAPPPRSFSERLRDFMGGNREPSMEDHKAMLLIRAMIAAANADGEISADERQAIMAKVDAANASADDRRAVEAELQAPKSVDALVAEVSDPETAEQVYVASRLAIRSGTSAERDYLSYLAGRLGIAPEKRRSLDQVA